MSYDLWMIRKSDYSHPHVPHIYFGKLIPIEKINEAEDRL